MMRAILYFFFIMSCLGYASHPIRAKGALKALLFNRLRTLPPALKAIMA